MIDPQTKEYIELGLKMMGIVAVIAVLVWSIIKLGLKFYNEKDNELKAVKKALKAYEEEREREEMEELRENFREVKSSLVIFKRQMVSAVRKLHKTIEENKVNHKENKSLIETLVVNSQNKFGIVAKHLEDIIKRIDGIEEGNAMMVKEISIARGLKQQTEPKKPDMEEIGKDLFILKGSKKDK
jgi:hypothetical protein